MDPAPSLNDLIWLFGCQPSYLYPEEARYWPYTTVDFEVIRDHRSLHIRLQPGDREVRLGVSVDGESVTDLLLRQVATVSVERLPGRELLRVDFDPTLPVSSLFARVKPDISLGWEIHE